MQLEASDEQHECCDRGERVQEQAGVGHCANALAQRISSAVMIEPISAPTPALPLM